MNNKSIAKKYAKALYNVANEKQDVKIVLKNIKYIVFAIRYIPELSYLLKTNKVSIENKINILENVLKNNISKLEIELITNLLMENNILLLSEIATNYEYLLKNDSNVVDMMIISSNDFSDDEVESIKSKIESKIHKKINLETKIDKKVIGGIKLRIGNTLIDNTISRRLDKLKNTLIQV